MRYFTVTLSVFIADTNRCRADKYHVYAVLDFADIDIDVDLC